MWEKKSTRLLLFLAYAASSCFLFLKHEVWRDEVDVWMMVQNLPFTQWRDYLRHSGHPGLFHLTLYPLVLLGGSFVIAQCLNFAYAMIGSGILLGTLAVPSWFVGLGLFGDFFLYRFPVFTRNYALGFLFLSIVLWGIHSSQRKNRIFAYVSLALLAHTHILFTLVAMAWGVYLISEWVLHKELRTELSVAILALVLSGLVVLYFVLPPSDGQFGSALQNNPSAWRIALTYTLLPSLAGWEFFYKFSWVLIIALSFLFRKHLSLLLLYITGTFLILFFFRFVYVAHLHHLSVLFTHIFFTYLLYWKKEKEHFILSLENKISVALFCFVFLSHIIFFAKIESQDIAKLYSGASSVLPFLKSCGWQKGDKIAGHGPDESKTILFYEEKGAQLYFPALQTYGSFMLWNKEFRDSYLISEQVLLERVQKEPIRFLVWNQPLQKKESLQQWESCGFNPPNSVIDPAEYFYVYRKIEK